MKTHKTNNKSRQNLPGEAVRKKQPELSSIGHTISEISADALNPPRDSFNIKKNCAYIKLSIKYLIIFVLNKYIQTCHIIG